MISDTERITFEQIEYMLHCIGWYNANKKGLVTGIKNRKYIAYRNHFSCEEIHINLQELVNIGFMDSVEQDGHFYYKVNLKGFKFLGKLLCCEITEMD